MNNNKLPALAAFIGTGRSGDGNQKQAFVMSNMSLVLVWNWTSMCALAAHDLVSRVQLAPRPVLREWEDHWSARLKN